MNDNLREITNMILYVLSIEASLETKCNIIDYILGLSRIHELELKEALNTPAPQLAMRKGEN